MILTVTPNTTLDWTILVPHFVWNETLRASQGVWGIGGKPASSSWILGELGIPSRAMGFAAGMTGQKLEAMLKAKGVETDFIQVEGETNTRVQLIHQENTTQSTLIVDNLLVKPAHVTQLLEKFEAALANADVVIAGGSLPHSIENNILIELVRMARQRDIAVALDAPGKYLLPALAEHPNVIRPNRFELTALAGKPVITVDEAYHAAKKILEQYGTEVIVTLGASQDSLAVLKDRAYLIPVPKVEEIISRAGAGDGVLAGIGHALASHKPMEEGLQLGFAAAGAVIMTPATADCRKADVDALLPTIQLIPYK